MSGETEADVSGWTTDTLRAHLLARFDDLRTMLDERYATQTKALDAAFVAQQTAMRTALDAAEKAVATALSSAEKAVTKAEVAAEKRFESVNEFRQQLADQTATFLTRTEYEAAHTSVTDKVSDMRDKVTALDQRLTSRLDLGQGAAAGAAGQRSEQRLNINAIIAVIGLGVSLIVAAAIVYATFHK